jgi:hypothetical protein
MQFDPDKFKAHRTFAEAVRHQDAVSRHASQAGASHTEIQKTIAHNNAFLLKDDPAFVAEAAKVVAQAEQITLNAWLYND